jgi:hypothetical protein
MMGSAKRLCLVLAASISSLLDAQDATPTPHSELLSPSGIKIGPDVHAPFPAPAPERDTHSDAYWADVKRAANDALAAGRQTRIHYSVYRASDFRDANKNTPVEEAQKRLNEAGSLLASGFCDRLPVHATFATRDCHFEVSMGWRRPSPPGIYLDLSFSVRVSSSNPQEKTFAFEIPDVAIPKWHNSYVYYSPPAVPERSFAVVFFVEHSM